MASRELRCACGQYLMTADLADFPKEMSLKLAPCTACHRRLSVKGGQLLVSPRPPLDQDERKKGVDARIFLG